MWEIIAILVWLGLGLLASGWSHAHDCYAFKHLNISRIDVVGSYVAILGGLASFIAMVIIILEDGRAYGWRFPRMSDVSEPKRKLIGHLFKTPTKD